MSIMLRKKVHSKVLSQKFIFEFFTFQFFFSKFRIFGKKLEMNEKWLISRFLSKKFIFEYFTFQNFEFSEKKLEMNQHKTVTQKWLVQDSIAKNDTIHFLRISGIKSEKSQSYNFIGLLLHAGHVKNEPMRRQ